VIRYWHDKLSNPVEMISQLCEDPFPRARMEAVLSAGFIPKAEAYAAILKTLDFESDKFMDTAFPQSVKALEPYWRPAMEAGTLSFAKNEHKTYAEKSAGLGFNQRLNDFIHSKHPAAKNMDDMKLEFARMAGVPHYKTCVKALLDMKIDPKVALTILMGMERQEIKSTDTLQRTLSNLTPLLQHHHADIVVATAKVFAKFKITTAAHELFSLLKNESKTKVMRIQAAKAIGQMGDANSTAELHALAKGQNQTLARLASFGIIEADVFDAASYIANLFKSASTQEDAVELIKALNRKSKASKALSLELAQIKIAQEVQEKVLAHHRHSGFLDKNLKPIFETPLKGSLSQMLIRENRDKLSVDVDQHGNPSRGEEIYRRKSMACTSCHSIGSAGPVIGPNLVAVGSAAPTSYIIEAILEPNRSIAEHYENIMFTLNDNSIRMGVVTFKGEKKISFKDASLGGEIVTLDKSDIKSQKVQPSIMPSGLMDQLKDRQEFLDLAKFVSMLGKPGPYANDERPVIRKWRVATMDKKVKQPNPNLPWSPVYSMVNGELPSSELNKGKSIYAEGYVNVQVPGDINLKLNQTKGVQLWLDGEKIKDLKAPIHMDKGRRTLTFSINPKAKKGLRVELESHMDSNARFTPEGGI
jgi:putative heme-binding domain-containing protein